MTNAVQPPTPPASQLVRACYAAAAVLLAIGLLIGFWPRSAEGDDCGSAFHPTDTFAQDFAESLSGGEPFNPSGEECSAAVSSMRLIAIIALVLGAGAGVYGLSEHKRV